MTLNFNTNKQLQVKGAQAAQPMQESPFEKLDDLFEEIEEKSYEICPMNPVEIIRKVIKHDLRRLNELKKELDACAPSRKGDEYKQKLEIKHTVLEGIYSEIKQVFLAQRSEALAQLSLPVPQALTDLIQYAHEHGKAWKREVVEKRASQIFTKKVENEGEILIPHAFFVSEEQEKYLAIWEKANLIGEGASRSVYRAINLSRGSGKFVIKKLIKDGNRHLYKMHNEQSVVNDLNRRQCPHIVRLLGGAAIPRNDPRKSVRNYALVYPYYQEKSLESLMKRKQLHLRGFSWADVINLLAPIAWMHENNFLNRDIKPGNILLNGTEFIFDDLEGVCQNDLSDFTDAQKEEQNKFKSSFVGTPFYVSPELARFAVNAHWNHKDQKEIKQYYAQHLPSQYKIHVDAWSLGMMLLEMAFQTHPLSEEGEKAMRTQKPRLSFLQLVSELPDDWFEKRVTELERATGLTLNPDLKPILKKLLVTSKVDRISAKEALDLVLKIPCLSACLPQELVGKDIPLTRENVAALETALRKQWVVPPTK